MKCRCICGYEFNVEGKAPEHMPERQAPFQLPRHTKPDKRRTWTRIDGQQRGVDISVVCKYSEAFMEITI